MVRHLMDYFASGGVDTLFNSLCSPFKKYVINSSTSCRADVRKIRLVAPTAFLILSKETSPIPCFCTCSNVDANAFDIGSCIAILIRVILHFEQLSYFEKKKLSL
eukprot:205448_1